VQVPASRQVANRASRWSRNSTWVQVQPSYPYGLATFPALAPGEVADLVEPVVPR
jgi:hypothetical protein